MDIVVRCELIAMDIVVRCERTLLIAVVGSAAPYSHSRFFLVFLPKHRRCIINSRLKEELLLPFYLPLIRQRLKT